MVELVINGKSIELSKDTSIKYVKQISEILDISSVACSYTNSFDFEKTPQNTHAMQQLGISGDSSLLPYQKNEATLKVDGFDLISKGWFNVSKTDEKYSGHIIDGMIDFFKEIENKTLGSDLNFSNFNHNKTMNTVIASFNNEYYNYIVADYGGKVFHESKLNIDYLAPCFSVKKIWELIFSSFGFSCNYDNLSYLDELYITYPKNVAENQTNLLIANLVKNPYRTFLLINKYGQTYPEYDYFWDSKNITQGSLESNWKYIIPETDSYFFDFTINMYCEYRRKDFHNRRVFVAVAILKNNKRVDGIYSDNTDQTELSYDTDRNVNFNLSCNKGDVIEVVIYVPQWLEFRDRPFYAQIFNHKKTDFKIYKTNLGTVSLENEFKDFSIKDFIKEIIWRTGLTPIIDSFTKKVDFITLDLRIDFQNAQDFSHCYYERTDESYNNSYAQKNSFKLKRNIDTDLNGDGYIYVPNVNLSEQKTLAQSKIYAPDKKIVTTFFNSFATNQYKIWDSEIKDNNGVPEISYKGLSGRFYFVRKQTKNGNFNLTSEVLIDNATVNYLPIAINTNTLFEEAIYRNYSEYQKIFNNFRIHTISLVMTITDFLSVDLTKPFYFKQENAYYICNKISFEEKRKSTGEFIKINKI